MQRSQALTLIHGLFGDTSLAKSSIRIYVDESVQSRVESGDLREMRFHEFDRRQFPLANLLSHGNG